MTRVIWKYPIKDMVLTLPRGSRPLAVQAQAGEGMLWVERPLENGEHQEQHAFRVHGTGHATIAPLEQYVGTWQEPPYVWHLYWTPPQGA